MQARCGHHERNKSQCIQEKGKQHRAQRKRKAAAAAHDAAHFALRLVLFLTECFCVQDIRGLALCHFQFQTVHILMQLFQLKLIEID